MLWKSISQQPKQKLLNDTTTKLLKLQILQFASIAIIKVINIVPYMAWSTNILITIHLYFSTIYSIVRLK